MVAESCARLGFQLVNHAKGKLLVFKHLCPEGGKPVAVRWSGWWAVRVQNLLESLDRGQAVQATDNMRYRNRSRTSVRRKQIIQ